MARFLMVAVAIATGVAAFCVGIAESSPHLRISFSRSSV